MNLKFNESLTVFKRRVSFLPNFYSFLVNEAISFIKKEMKKEIGGVRGEVTGGKKKSSNKLISFKINVDISSCFR